MAVFSGRYMSQRFKLMKLYQLNIWLKDNVQSDIYTQRCFGYLLKNNHPQQTHYGIQGNFLASVVCHHSADFSEAGRIYMRIYMSFSAMSSSYAIE